MEIQSVIRELLHNNNFISLPGIGSFVKVYEQARLSADGNQFIPPKQTVTFDTSRTFNDEAIELYLQSKEGLSPSESTEKVNIFIDKLKTQLSSGEKVHFESIGDLKMDKKGKIELILVPNDELASDTYGLNPVELPFPIQKSGNQESSTIDKHKPVKQMPRKVLAGIFTAVIIIGIFLLSIWFFVPELRFGRTTSKEYLQTKNEVAETKKEPVSEDLNSLVDDTVNTEKNAELIVKSVDTKTDKKQALYYQEPKPQDKKTYYIISGSFTNIENAQKHYDLLLSKGHRPEIIQGNGNYRVSLVKFSDRNRALSELERLRQQNPNQSIWLLGL